MHTRLRALNLSASAIRQRLAQVSMGGSWASSQPAEVQHNLRNFWFDGLFASANDAILLTYLTLYILALGASEVQIGLMSSLGSLAATLVLLPGALMVERLGYRKRIVVATGGIGARIMILLMVLAPFVVQGPGLVALAIGLEVVRQALGNIALPAWVSLSGDIVPMAWRGRYFASRNIVMSLANILIVILTGQMITRMDQPGGYQVALGLAFGFGITSAYFFSRLKEPPMQPFPAKETPTQPVPAEEPPVQPAPAKETPTQLVPAEEPVQKPRALLSRALISRELFRPLLENRLLLMFCLSAALWNFALNISGPFFSVYQAKVLMLTPATIGLLATVSSLSGLPAQRIIGPLTDRLGPRRVQLITGFLIPLLPIGWLFVTRADWAPWQITLINLAGGFLWAGYSLASFNMLLALMPAEQRARLTALYQVIVTISLAAGAAVGGVLVSTWGYAAVFVASALLRWAAAIIFAKHVK